VESSSQLFLVTIAFTARLTFQSFHDKIQKKVLESLSEPILNQILDELKSLNSWVDNMDSRFDGIDSRLGKVETELKDIKEHTKDIPAIKQAVLENLALTKQVDTAQASFERKVSSELTTHGHSIDILNRRQLKFEAELESLKKSLS